MKKNRTLQSMLFLIFLSAAFISQAEISERFDQQELEIILAKCAEYCERLDNSVLYFVCEEKITEMILEGRVAFVIKNKYKYDYQLIRKANKFVEQRILTNENGQKKKELDAKLKTKRFHHKYIIFGSLGLLSRKQQKNYKYKIIRNVTYKKEKAVILEASPKTLNGINALYGKIWVRKEDCAILKIEWEQESLENFVDFEKLAEDLEAKPKITFISEFGFEKNKIRFPSKFSVEERYIPIYEQESILWSKTTVIYDSYKFFTVETEVKYK